MEWSWVRNVNSELTLTLTLTLTPTLTLSLTLNLIFTQIQVIMHGDLMFMIFHPDYLNRFNSYVYDFDLILRHFHPNSDI